MQHLQSTYCVPGAALSAGEAALKPLCDRGRVSSVGGLGGLTLS
jgi:hypothetical protein